VEGIISSRTIRLITDWITSDLKKLLNIKKSPQGGRQEVIEDCSKTVKKRRRQSARRCTEKAVNKAPAKIM